MKDDELSRYAGTNISNSPNTRPYPTSRLAPIIELVDLAQQISNADTLIASHANAKLKVIADHIHRLQDEARSILEQARQDQALHRASCHFKRQPGGIYHLYKKDNGECYFSMLSPAEWGLAPHAYVGTYRLETDQSWTALTLTADTTN